MIKRTLEQRIARLEKLLNGKVKKSYKFEKTFKNESVLPYDIISDLNSVFYDHFGNEDNYSTEREFEENMFAACEGDNDMMVDDAIMYLANDYGHDEEGLQDLRDDIADYIAGCAEKVCKQEGWKEEWDEEEFLDIDDEYEDGMDECRDRNYESRKVIARKAESRKRAVHTSKVESNRPLKRTKNEAVKQLPNGMTANNVADVLSGFAGTSWSNPRAAIAKLDRMGILDASTNKWYPTVDDVAAAIEDCWNDSIGNGRGAAEFFIGNFGGATRCSLTLYPISGGTSRARNLTIKFNWPEEDMM